MQAMSSNAMIVMASSANLAADDDIPNHANRAPACALTDGNHSSRTNASNAASFPGGISWIWWRYSIAMTGSE